MTEEAKFDPDLVGKNWKYLNEDKTVIITTGLLKALQGKGIEKIVEVDYTGRTVPVNKFSYRETMELEPAGILCRTPKFRCRSWLMAWWIGGSPRAFTKTTTATRCCWGVRGLLKGKFYILTIPESFDDLYHLPQPILSQIRRDMMGDIPVYLDAPAKICLFTYDNNTFIAKSYLPYLSRYSIVIKKPGARLTSLVTGSEVRGGYTKGNTTVFDVIQQPRRGTTWYRFE